MEPKFDLFLCSSKDAVAQYWPAAEPLIAKYLASVEDDTDTIENIQREVSSGKMFMFVVKADTVTGPIAKLVILATVTQSSVEHTLYIRAIAGDDLASLAGTYWNAICGWAYVIGVRVIDGHVSPEIERLIRPLGFKRPKTFVYTRLDLTGSESNA